MWPLSACTAKCHKCLHTPHIIIIIYRHMHTVQNHCLTGGAGKECHVVTEQPAYSLFLTQTQTDITEMQWQLTTTTWNNVSPTPTTNNKNIKRRNVKCVWKRCVANAKHASAFSASIGKYNNNNQSSSSLVQQNEYQPHCLVYHYHFSSFNIISSSLNWKHTTHQQKNNHPGNEWFVKIIILPY